MHDIIGAIMAASGSDENSEIELRFIRLGKVPVPAKATAGAAGFDCVALKREFLTSVDGELRVIEAGQAKQFDLVRYSTGLALEIPPGHVGLAFARSSISKMPLILANTTGVIDSDFRGELSFMFRILNPDNIAKTAYQVGDRIGQILIMSLDDIKLIEADRLSESDRGHGAYGSTGR